VIVPSDPAVSMQSACPLLVLGLLSVVAVVVVATRAPMAKVGTQSETVTVALAEAESTAPVQLTEYVVVVKGVTVTDPENSIPGREVRTSA
jgi:hypothetical protein